MLKLIKLVLHEQLLMNVDVTRRITFILQQRSAITDWTTVDKK